MTRDANEIAQQYSRREEETQPTVGVDPRYRGPRYGRLIGAVIDPKQDHPAVDEDGQNVWHDVAVQPWADGLLMLEHQDENLRTIVNARAYLFLEFRPNDEGE